MKNTLTVAICDRDNYFSEGIKYALRDYFHQKGQSVIFVTSHSAVAPADLVFAAAPDSRRARYCHVASVSTCNTLFFSIRKKTKCYQTHLTACQREAGTLYRSGGLAAIYRMLDRALAANPKIWFRNSCALCTSSQLTQRELEVLHYLREGVSQAETAEHMQLSVKTVNTHKQSAMRKMDLKRKHDFIHWLMCRE
ncbi:Nitrogen regulation protein C [Serratia plymuthica]|nr:Nitrogen regulation protein C [Serratia plymuthica]VEI15702.1 Nitrogen regulation protein C [Serratia plymuthica]